MLKPEQIEEIAELTKDNTEQQIKFFIGECLLAQATIDRNNRMRNRSFDPELLEEIHQKVKKLQKQV